MPKTLPLLREIPIWIELILTAESIVYNYQHSEKYLTTGYICVKIALERAAIKKQ